MTFTINQKVLKDMEITELTSTKQSIGKMIERAKTSRIKKTFIADKLTMKLSKNVFGSQKITILKPRTCVIFKKVTKQVKEFLESSEERK
jgi:hypothetical protein